MYRLDIEFRYNRNPNPKHETRDTTLILFKKPRRWANQTIVEPTFFYWKLNLNFIKY